jgi:hypothetical protein
MISLVVEISCRKTKKSKDEQVENKGKENSLREFEICHTLYIYSKKAFEVMEAMSCGTWTEISYKALLVAPS